MSTLVEDVLHTWREGERLLDRLTPLDPDHETVRLAVAQMRKLYQEVTTTRESTNRRLAATAARLEMANALLAQIEARLAQTTAEAEA